MTDYTKTTDFTSKDSLPSGDSGKIIRGAEFGTEFDNIQTAVNSKSNKENPSFTGNITVTGTVDGRDIAADGTKLDTIETSADVTDTANVTAAGAVMDSELTDITAVKALNQGVATTDSPTFAAVTSTGNVTVGGTVDGRDVAADGTKLDTVETNADVTDTTNVTAAGALMDSELTSEAAVKALNQGVATTDSPTFAGATVNGTVEFDGLSGTGAVTVTDILDQDDMSSNSATALATQQSIKSYVDSQVATSDTLAEVLANGNATGGTDVAFGDNDKAIFGAGSDLQIYHDGSNSYVTDAGTGDLRLSANNLRMQNADNTVNYIKANNGSNVELFFNNASKLATTATGIDVTGVITTDGMTTSADINFGDNDKAVFGAGSDLQIYHDGSASYIDDAGTGNLRIRANSSLSIQKYTGETMGVFTADGSVLLAHDNVTRLETTSTGIDVTGNATFDDNGKAIFGAGSDLQIYHNGSRSVITDQGTGPLRISATNLEFKNAGDTKLYANATDGGAFNIYYDNTARLATTSTGIDVTGTVTADGLTVDGAVSVTNVLTVPVFSTTTIANTRGLSIYNNQSGGFLDTTLVYGNSANSYFAVGHHNGTSYTERLRIDASGNVGIGTSPTNLSNYKVLHVQSGHASAGGYIRLQTNAASEYADIFNFNDSLYKDANTQIFRNKDGSTEYMRIDSSGNVGIGAASAPSRLTVKSPDNTLATNIAQFDSLNGGAGFKFGYQRIEQIGATTPITFETGGSESMRIDSSGNLLVGTTNVNPAANNVTGHALKAGGLVEHANSGAMVMRLNRTDSSGSIIEFRQGAGAVGSIGTASSRVYIGTDDTGLRFTNDEITPFNPSVSADRNGTVDLGGSSTRFKDLHLSGTANVGGVYNTGIYNQQSGDIQFWVPNVGEAVRIQQNTGNLLVGTTSESTWESAKGFRARNSGSTTITRDGNPPLYVNRLSSDGTLLQFQKGTTVVGNIGVQDNDNLYVSGSAASHAGIKFGTGTVTPMVTGSNADNSVDLGTSSVRFKDLYLSSGIKTNNTTIDINSGSSNTVATFTSTDTEAQIDLVDSTGSAQIRSRNDLRFYVNGGNTRAVDIDASGNLLVGTAAQSGKVTINNGGSTTGLNVFQTSTATNYVPLNIHNDRVTGGNTAVMIRFQAGDNTDVGSIDSTVTATAYNTSSDQRLKDNIVDAPSASDDIDAIQVRSFDWKADGSHQKYGMVAQELNTVAPEAVSAPEDPEEMMGVDYSKLVPMLVKEIQSLRARVAQLETN